MNRRLLKNIRKSDKELAIFSTGVKMTTNLKGDLPGYGMVWFHPGDIVNIISLSKLTEKYLVVYDSNGGKTFLVCLPRVKVINFKQYDRRMFYSDMAAGKGVVLLNTVEHNKYNYPKHDYTRALLARKIQYKIASPSQRHLFRILENKNQILNFLLNWIDVRGAERIWGEILNA